MFLNSLQLFEEDMLMVLLPSLNSLNILYMLLSMVLAMSMNV